MYGREHTTVYTTKMILQIHIIRPYQSLDKVFPINVNSGGVTECLLQTQKSNSYQLSLKINPTIGSTVYDLLDDQSIGLRVSIDGTDLAFVRRSSGLETSQTLDGNKLIKFISNDFLLTDVNQNPRILSWNTVFKGTALDYLQNISQNFIFSYIGAPPQVSLATGVRNNFELLQLLAENEASIDWRINGIKTDTDGIEKTEILVGDFSSGETKYRINNASTNSNPYKSRDLIYVSNVVIRESGEVLSKVTPIGNSGLGADNSSMIFLTNPGADYVQPHFPLVQSGTTLSDGTVVYDIQNTLNSSSTSRGEVFTSKMQTNVVDALNAATLSYEESQKNLYERAVSYMQSRNDTQKYDVDIEYNSFILPLEKIDVDYRIKRNFFGFEETLKIEGIFYTQERRFDLSNYFFV